MVGGFQPKFSHVEFESILCTYKPSDVALDAFSDFCVVSEGRSLECIFLKM